MTQYKERPILFSTPMVRSLLDGTKTQTRRPYKVRRHPDFGCEMAASELAREDQHAIDRICPYGQPGDRLWVRETWTEDPEDDGTWAYTQYMGCKGSPLSDIPRKFQKPEHCIYREGWDGSQLVWRPSIHMPRWASRILLEIVSVRVEQLQDISEADSRAEGIADGGCTSCGNPEPCGCAHPSPSARDAFCDLWERIHGADSWAENPWVWVVEFKRVPA